jgi:hypothetical protein
MSKDGSKATSYTDIDVSAEACAARLNLKAAESMFFESKGTADEALAYGLLEEAAFVLRAIQNRRNGR